MGEGGLRSPLRTRPGQAFLCSSLESVCALYLAPLPPNQGPGFLLLLPPQKESPTSPKLRHIGMEIFMWSHSAALSPVHTAPEEEKKAGIYIQ